MGITVQDADQFFLQSEEGVKAAQVAYEAFSVALEGAARVQSLESQRSDTFLVVGGVGPLYALCGHFVWFPASLSGAYLLSALYDGFPDIPDFHVSYGPGRQLGAARYEFRPGGPGTPIWAALDGDDGEFDTQSLAEHVIQGYLAASRPAART